MWVGTGTSLQARRLPANSELSNKHLLNLNLRSSVQILPLGSWQRDIDKEPITFVGIKTEYVDLKESIHSLYQEALYGQVTDKLSYDIIILIASIDRVKKAADRYIRNEN